MGKIRQTIEQQRADYRLGWYHAAKGLKGRHNCSKAYWHGYWTGHHGSPNLNVQQARDLHRWFIGGGVY